MFYGYFCIDLTRKLFSVNSIQKKIKGAKLRNYL
jgi:hypothetical protein